MEAPSLMHEVSVRAVQAVDGSAPGGAARRRDDGSDNVESVLVLIWSLIGGVGGGCSKR